MRFDVNFIQPTDIQPLHLPSTIAAVLPADLNFKAPEELAIFFLDCQLLRSFEIDVSR